MNEPGQGDRHMDRGLQETLVDKTKEANFLASQEHFSDLVVEKPVPKKRPSDIALSENEDRHISVAGRKTMKGSETLNAPREGGVSSADPSEASTRESKNRLSSPKILETQEDDEVEQEINIILEKGPSEHKIQITLCLH